MFRTQTNVRPVLARLGVKVSTMCFHSVQNGNVDQDVVDSILRNEGIAPLEDEERTHLTNWLEEMVKSMEYGQSIVGTIE